jgi:hypothetical protein
MALGLLGVGIGVAVTYYRGGFRHDPDGPDSPPIGTVVPPAGLTGLRFLPPECNVVAGVQVGPVLAYAERTGQDPKALLTAAGLPLQVFAKLDEAGLTLQQVDHLAFGLNLPGKDDAPVTAVLAVVLRRPPDDDDEFLQAFKAKRDPGGKKDRYAIAVAGIPVQPTLLRVSGREWVISLNDTGLNRAAGGPEPGAGHLSAGLRELLTEKLPPDAAVWLAADDRNWAEKDVVQFLVKKLLNQPQLMPVLAKGEAVAAGLSFGEQPRARVYVRATDESTGKKLRAYFQEKVTDGATTGGAGRSALFDAPFDPRAGAGTLRRFLDDLGK